VRARHIAVLVLATVGVAVGAWAADPVAEVLRTQLAIEQRLLAGDLNDYERLQAQIDDSGNKLVRMSADLVRAEKDGEDLAGFTARAADLSRTEVEVTALIAKAQQLRVSLAARRAYVEQLILEVRRLEDAAGGVTDELTGRWAIVIEPGGQKGTMELRLEGTIVSGTYQLSGGWKGSLRGTYIGEQVRMERIDAQQGFVAVYSGRLVARSGEKRLEGAWEATGLGTGQPVSGSWVARRELRP
jgi:hypothetical protein